MSALLSISPRVLLHTRRLCTNRSRQLCNYASPFSTRIGIFSSHRTYSNTQRKWSPNTIPQQQGGNKSSSQDEQQYHRLTSLYLTRKHYYIMGGIVFVGACIVIHYFFPDHSLFDYILKYGVYGGPYRDYVLLGRGAFLHNGAADAPDEMIYIPHEMHFELGIPEHFVHPGLVLTEDTTYKTKGWFSMTDPLHQNLLVEWKEIMQLLTENEQTRFTPMDEMLKACAYMHVKELQDTLGEGNVHVQRCEHLSMQKADSLLDPLPFASTEHYGNMVCLVNKIHNPYKKEDKWEGDLWFMHTPYIFHIRLTYPSSLSQMAQESDPQQALRTYASKISCSSEYQDQICRKVRVVNDPKEISLMLRNDLIQIYMKNKFKKHFAAVPMKDMEKPKTDDTKEEKKGWFW